jgi:hypothetical protein
VAWADAPPGVCGSADRRGRAGASVWAAGGCGRGCNCPK